MEAEEFQMIVKRKPIIRKANDPDPLPGNFKFTCEWTYRDPQANNRKVADGHFYELDDGTTTDHDPKHLEVDGQKYALFEGTGLMYDVLRDFTVLLKRHGRPYRAYVAVRRFTCARWGW